MKKISFYFTLFFIIFSSCLVVNAVEYPLNTLIPVGEIATVRTEMFDYNDFSFLTVLEKEHGVIRFGSIHNNLAIKKPVSVNILLFNQNKINIGFLTYCSEKDFDGPYASYVLNGNGYSSYSINVSKKFLGEEWSPKDVSYIAVMDENKFCHIGGYKNYVGKTIEEITNKETQPSHRQILVDKILLFVKSDLFVKILIGLGIFIAYLLFCSRIDFLHKKMYMHGTRLSYLPIAQMYVTIRMVFGGIVAIAYLILLVLSGILFFLKIRFLMYSVIIFWILSLILAIIKVITKKYDLFYFEPTMNSSAYFDNTENSSNQLYNHEMETDSFSNNIFNNNSINSNNQNNSVNTVDDDFYGGIPNDAVNVSTGNNNMNNQYSSSDMSAPLANNVQNSLLNLEEEGIEDNEFDDEYDDDSDLSKFY